jgi:hypothetical protein
MSLHDRPSLAELLAAVRAYIADEVVPAAADRRARFRALIAANVLAIAERELALGPADARAEADALRRLGYARNGSAAGADAVDDVDAARRDLCRDIRAGAFDSAERFVAASAYAREIVVRKLAVANPRFRTIDS